METFPEAIFVEHDHSYSLEKIHDLHCAYERPEDFIPGQRLSPCRYLAVSVGQPDAGNLAYVRFHCSADVLFLFPVWSSLLLGSNLGFRLDEMLEVRDS